MTRLAMLIAIALSLCSTATGQQYFPANSGPGGGGTLTGCGFGQTLNGTVCDNNTATMTTNLNLQAGTPLLCVGSASTTASCTMNPSPVSYTSGMLVNFVAGIGNTTTYGLNINGIGSVSILNSTGGALVSGDIVNGVSYLLRYDGTAFRLPAGGGSAGTAVSSPVIAPFGSTLSYTFTAIGSANRVHYYKFSLLGSAVVQHFNFFNQGRAGTFGLAIQKGDCSGIVAGTSATGTPTSSTESRISMSAPVTLSAGSYYLAITSTVGTDTYYQAGGSGYGNVILNVGESAGTFGAFYGSNPSSGGVISGACGTQTALTAADSPLFLILK